MIERLALKTAGTYITLLRCIILSMVVVPLNVNSKPRTQRAKQRIAIVNFTKAGHPTHSRLSESDLYILTEAARDETARLPKSKFKVMTQENILEMLPPDTDLSECEGACEIETGRMIGAHFIITGTIIEWSKRAKLRASIKVHRIVDGEQLESVKVSAKSVEALEKKVTKAVKRMFVKLGWLGARSRNRTIRYTTDPDDVVIAEFRSKPRGAQVTIDGLVICNAKQPKCIHEVTVGDHDVVMSLKDHFTRREEVTIQRRRDKKRPLLNWALEPSYALLLLDIEPKFVRHNGKKIRSTVRVNGKKVKLYTKAGRKSLTRHRVRAFERPVEVSVTSPCHEPTSDTIELFPGDKKRIKLRAKPLYSGVKVRARDRTGAAITATVHVDGQRQPKAAPGTFRVPSCSQKLVLTNPKVGRAERVLQLQPNTTREYVINVIDNAYRNQIRRDRERRRTWGWTSLWSGATFVAGAGALLLWVVPQQVAARDDALADFDSPDLQAARTHDDRRGIYQTAGWVSGSIGAVLGGVGMYLLSTEPAQPDFAILPILGPQGLGLSGTF